MQESSLTLFGAIQTLIQLRDHTQLTTYASQNPAKMAFLAYGLAAAFSHIARHNGLLPKKSVKGQHVFITGGAMGIGRQMARRFAKLGCKVTIADLNEEQGLKTVEEIKSFNKDCNFVKCDVTNKENISQAGKQCREMFGSVDILINNAGIVTGKKILDSTQMGINLTYNVNAVSHAYTVQEFLPDMLKNNKGHIVSIASIAGHLGVAGMADYCGSKFAAVGFDESLRMELHKLKSDVKTTCICPYYINTGMFDGIRPSWIMNLLLPILDENYVGQRIVNAVRQEEQMVLIPFFLYVLVFIRSILPTASSDFLMRLFKVNDIMDHFKGRK